jgi:hypothetical protein
VGEEDPCHATLTQFALEPVAGGERYIEAFSELCHFRITPPQAVGLVGQGGIHWGARYRSRDEAVTGRKAPTLSSFG